MDRQITVVKTIVELRRNTKPIWQAGKSIGLVPTMGALHAGHLSLAKQSVQQCDCTVATIFVNPTQFAPDEDLSEYPRTLEQDVQLLEDAGVDFVFIPESEEMYPEGSSTSVSPPELALSLEGEFRKTHFSGVCTVVLKLMNIAMPNVAFLGQKDFQQASVIKQMVADLNVAVEIVVCPIVRDPDGLALSSRNRYLDPEQRQVALCLNRTLQYVADEIDAGQTDAHCLMAEMRQSLIEGGVTGIDYAVLCDPQTLQLLADASKPAVALLAAFVGKTRLIDNRLFE